jgi:hypothetical protein
MCDILVPLENSTKAGSIYFIMTSVHDPIVAFYSTHSSNQT